MPSIKIYESSHWLILKQRKRPTIFLKAGLLVLVLLLSKSTFGQTDRLLRFTLNNDENTYVQASLRAQFWARYAEMNPGTTVNGEPVKNAFDFSVRRVRFGLSAQLSPKLFVYSLWGGNNINARTEKDFDFDVLDLNAEYSFSTAIALGVGEHAWEGLSRWTVRSSKSLMALDAPLFSLLTVNKNDDLARGLGVWLKGQVGKFDYVAALKKPVNFGVAPQENVVDFGLNNSRMRTSAYLKYEFLEDESAKTAYSGGTGTYLGKKKLLNLGAGFLYQPQMTSTVKDRDTVFYDFNNWAVELFYDAPVGKTSALTFYLGYFHTDFGPGYIRNLGPNDYTEGGTSFNGSGIDFPMMGTGNTWFFQFGYFLGWPDTENRRGLQPNIAVQYSDFEKLTEPVLVLDIGINVYFGDHSNKLTLGYQDRPVYRLSTNADLSVAERKGQWVLQYQIEIL